MYFKFSGHLPLQRTRHRERILSAVHLNEAILPLTAAVDNQPTLVERARRGDLEAFEQLVIEHERGVLRLAFRLLHSIDDAQDVAQEVFLRLHRNLSGIDAGRGLRPWLYSVTVNLCRDIQRRKRPGIPIAQVTPVSLDNPERNIEWEQRKQVLAAAMESLAGKERAALVLRDVEGLSTAEVAERLGSSESTVRSQISTARVKLRNAVEKLMRKKR